MNENLLAKHKHTVHDPPYYEIIFTHVSITQEKNFFFTVFGKSCGNVITNWPACNKKIIKSPTQNEIEGKLWMETPGACLIQSFIAWQKFPLPELTYRLKRTKNSAKKILAYLLNKELGWMYSLNLVLRKHKQLVVATYLEFALEM